MRLRLLFSNSDESSSSSSSGSVYCLFSIIILFLRISCRRFLFVFFFVFVHKTRCGTVSLLSRFISFRSFPDSIDVAYCTDKTIKPIKTSEGRHRRLPSIGFDFHNIGTIDCQTSGLEVAKFRYLEEVHSRISSFYFS